MTQAHVGSHLKLKEYILPIEYKDIYFPFYWNKASGRGHLPSLDVGTIVPDNKFGRVLAVEKSTNNLWTDFVNGTSPKIYNNLGNTKLPATITKLEETFMGNPIWRLEMTPTTSDALSNLQINLHSHGIYSELIDFLPNTSYCSSIYWRPVSHMDIEVGGTASNILGWSDGTPNTGLRVGNNWRRNWAYKTSSETTQSDGVFWSFKSPSVQLNEKVIIDWSMGQVELDTVTSFAKGSRNAGIASYSKELLNVNQFTISTWVSVDTLNYRYNPIFEVCNGPHQFNRLLLMFDIEDSGKTLRLWSDNDVLQNSNLTTTFKPNLHEWYLITLTYDGTTYKLYKNGELIGSTLSVPASFQNNATINIGGSYWGNLNGKLSGFMIRPYVTLQSEIEMWYHYEKHLYDPYDYYTI